MDLTSTEDPETLFKPNQPTEMTCGSVEGKEDSSKGVDLKTPYKNKIRSYDNEELFGLTRGKDGKEALHLMVNTKEGKTETRYSVAILIQTP